MPSTDMLKRTIASGPRMPASAIVNVPSTANSTPSPAAPITTARVKLGYCFAKPSSRSSTVVVSSSARLYTGNTCSPMTVRRLRTFSSAISSRPSVCFCPSACNWSIPYAPRFSFSFL
ncbi:hypothetical protein FEQ05_05802 [Burkholderia pseudomultivorans]|nr:hypothetical protein [Burkholderia pseudomultivorans]